MTADPSRIQTILFRVFLGSWTVFIVLGLYWVWFGGNAVDGGLEGRLFQTAFIVGVSSLLTMSAVRIKADTKDG